MNDLPMDEVSAREFTLRRNQYYMTIAEAVKGGAKCTGSNVGAVIVRGDRVVSTGYNGTPAGFPDCHDQGCVRCHDSQLREEGRGTEMSDINHRSGTALDRCICVHAEQNAVLTAARFGIALEGSALYTTHSPCLGCLKELMQVGINRIVFKSLYEIEAPQAVLDKYWQLVDHFRDGEVTRFEHVDGEAPRRIEVNHRRSTDDGPEPFAPPEAA